MKDFFDTVVNIPDARKPGKYINSILRKEQVNYISDLVQSLTYCVVEITDLEEGNKALHECHSCQSDSLSRRRLYYDVWSRVPDCKIIGLYEKEKNEFQARCIVNPKEGTYAPIYGDLHFLLKARLLFAGYEEGPVTTEQTCEEILDDLVKDKTTTRAYHYSAKMPKSSIKTEAVILYDLYKNLESSKIKREELVDKWLEEYRLNGKIGGASHLEQTLWKELGKVKEKVNKLAKDQANYERKKRKYGEKDGMVIYTVTTHIPISEEWQYKEVESMTENTSFYLDSVKKFLKETWKRPSGWYRK